MGSFNSTLGTTCLLEYLITMLCRKYPDRCSKRLGEREQMVAPLLLVPRAFFSYSTTGNKRFLIRLPTQPGRVSKNSLYFLVKSAT